MNDLIAAAKAVIDAAESYKRDFAPFADEIRTLRAAVERAEKQEVVGFDEYWRKEKFRWDKNLQRDVQAVWNAAQQAEREWFREIVNSELDVNGRDDDWYIVCNAILEKIDERVKQSGKSRD